MLDFSGMLTVYFYVLFGSLLFIAILAAARAFGADFFHHDVALDHTVNVNVGVESHVETGGQAVEGDMNAHGASAETDATTGLVKFQGMTLMTISIFMVSFAATGILGLYYVVRPYNLEPSVSIPLAGVASGVLAVGLSYAAFKYFIATAAGSEISLRDIVGKNCEVTVGAAGNQLGEVRCDVKGQIMSFPARSADGSRIGSGDHAHITGMTGNIAVVQKRSNQ